MSAGPPPGGSPLLVLFDIDGTLLLDDAYVHGASMVAAARAVYGVELADDAVMAIGPHGRTDPQILRAMVAARGVDDAACDAGLTRWAAAAEAEFAARAAAARDRWRVRPGLQPMLERLDGIAVCGVLTGNLAGIARIKLRLMGLDRLLEGPGAFGLDAADRAGLVPVARERAGAPGAPWPAARTYVVGDTPADVAAALADGARAIGFASARFDAAALTGAVAVIADADELPRVLRA